MQLKINTNLPTAFNVIPNTGFKDRFTLGSENADELLSVLSECMLIYPSGEYQVNHKERFLEIVPYYYLELLPEIFNRLKLIDNQAPTTYLAKMLLTTVMTNCYYILEDMLAVLDDLDYHYASFEDFFNTHTEPVELWIGLIKRSLNRSSQDNQDIIAGSFTYEGKSYSLMIVDNNGVATISYILLETDLLSTLNIYSCVGKATLQQVYDEVFTDVVPTHPGSFSVLTIAGVKHNLDYTDILDLENMGVLKGFIVHE